MPARLTTPAAQGLPTIRCMGSRNPSRPGLCATALALLAALGLAGCSQRNDGLVRAGPEPLDVGRLRGDDGPASWAASGAGRKPATNLVLGPRAGLAPLGQSFAGRAPWPATAWGYVLEDVTYFRRDSFDGQLLFDRFNSSYFVNESSHSGVVVR